MRQPHIKGFAIVSDGGKAFRRFKVVDGSRDIVLGDPCEAACFDKHYEAQRVREELDMRMPGLHFRIYPVMN